MSMTNEMHKTDAAQVKADKKYVVKVKVKHFSYRPSEAQRGLGS